MNSQRRIIIFTISGSLLLAFGLFQNCAPHKMSFGDIEMAQLMSTSALYFETDEDTPLINKVPRAADLAHKSSSVTVTSSPKHGDITLNPSGDFTYVPYKDFFGEDEFEYSETGAPTNNLINKKVLILVRSLNDAPWLETDLVNFEMNTPKKFSLIGKDVEDSKIDVLLDERGETKNISTSKGHLEMLAPGSFKYTPADFFRGVDTYEFILRDTNGAVVTKKVTLMVGNPFHNLKPALAIRGPSCISCHAKVDSDMVTDFGKGDPFEIAKHAPFNGKNLAENYYGIRIDYHEKSLVGSWSTSAINATVTVPAVTLGFDPKTEVEKLRIPYADWVNKSYPNIYTAEQIKKVFDVFKARPEFKLTSTAKLKDFVTAIESQKTSPAVVQEKSTVFIGAPTAAVILQRAGMKVGSSPKFIKNNQSTSPFLSGIQSKTGGYYQNTAEVVCDGDLIIDGTLFLNNLVLKTDDGCRIMTTGPIFIQGTITYKRIDEARTENYTNLQLVSSRLISIGIGQTHCEVEGTNPGWYSSNTKGNQNPFLHRFNDYGAFTRLTGANTDLLAKDKEYNIFEAAKIKDLKDASCYSGTVKRGISLERLLLNAPRVDSRYTGQFNGIVISEAALFSLSKFTFKYDRVFDRVPILPILLPTDFFVVK